MIQFGLGSLRLVRLVLLVMLSGFILQATAVVLEKGDISVERLTVPEIEDKLQVTSFDSHSKRNDAI